MRHKLLISISFVVIALCACQRETLMNSNGIEISFNVSFADENKTKTILSENDLSVWWSARDSIKVFYGSQASSKFVSINDYSTKSTVFTGNLNVATGVIESDLSGNIWAVYPYDSNCTCDENSVTLEVPSKQIAKAGTFAPKMFPSIARANGYNLAFYNVCGGIVFSVDGEGIRTITLSGNNEEILAGKVKVSFDEDGIPAIQQVIAGEKTITLIAPSAGTFIPGEQYYITILPGSLKNGFSLSFRKTTMEGLMERTDSTGINRSRFRKVLRADAGISFNEVSPIDAIVFEDPQVKEKLVAAFDGNGDGELSYKEASEVTSLDGVFGDAKNYRSFNEFQHFTGITTIPDEMFKGWEISSIVLPETIQEIGRRSFEDCCNLAAISLPESLITIMTNAFKGCVKLKELSIPKNVTSFLGDFVDECSSLEEIQILSYSLNVVPGINVDNLKTIVAPNITFSRYGEIKWQNIWGDNVRRTVTRITILAGNENLEANTFQGFSALREIELPDNLISIGRNAFTNCSSLKTIRIKEGVTSIAVDAFTNCTALELVELPSTYEPSKNDVLISFDNQIESVTLPCHAIPSHLFPNSPLKHIKVLFNPLKSSELPEFYCGGFDALVDVELPEGLLIIKQNAFKGCTSLERITIPSSVGRIDNGTFENCFNLKEMTVLTDVPPALGYTALETCIRLKKIYVPANAVEQYRAASGWSRYKDIIMAIEE